MMEKVEAELCEQVVVFQFSRFARSTTHLLKALEKFKSKNVRFISVCESLDTNSPMGLALLTILGCLSQLERELIRERAVHAAKLEFKKLKADQEKKKFEELTRDMAANSIAQTVD
jgi:DNA invertase Pin-like site-specific DNA recombinase